MAEPAIEPIHQFRIYDLFNFGTFGGDGATGGIHIGFTNSALFMVLILAVVLGFLLLGSRRRAIVPGRM